MAVLPLREFAALVVAAPFAYTRGMPAAGPITAEEVIARIKKNIGVTWKPDSVDTVKAGDPSTIAKGIVTSSMATMVVLQRAVKAGANVVITAQPTFYGRADLPTSPTGRGGANQAAAPPDPIFAGKNAFITRNNLVVFRLSDHWRQRQPDPLALGIVTALGWAKYQSAGDPLRCEIPTLTLDALVNHVKRAAVAWRHPCCR